MLPQIRSYNQWTESEKRALAALVAEQQARFPGRRMDWKAVAAQIGTKSPRQCYDQSALARRKPARRQKAHCWLLDEEELLLKAFRRAPFQWEQIQRRFFPRLSVTQLKNKLYAMAEADALRRGPKPDGAALAAELARLLEQ